MNRPSLALLLALGSTGCEAEPIARPQAPSVVQAAPLTDGRNDTSTQAGKTLEEKPASAPAKAPEWTNKEFEALVASERARIAADGRNFFTYLETDKAEYEGIEAKFKELFAQQGQIDLGAFGGDTEFSFSHDGVDGFLGHGIGEGKYVRIQQGNTHYDINLTGGAGELPVTMWRGGNEGYTEIPATDKRVIAAIDFAIAGLKEALAAKPSYRRVDGANKDVISNMGVNLRDDNNRVFSLAPIDSYLMTVGEPDAKGSIFVYSEQEGTIVSGWANAKYLKAPTNTSTTNDVEEKEAISLRMKVTEAAAGSNGLSLRRHPSTSGDPIARMPVGTEVVVTDKEISPSSGWAEVEYTDAAGKVQTGWACMYMTYDRYLVEVK